MSEMSMFKCSCRNKISDPNEVQRHLESGFYAKLLNLDI